MSAAAHTLGPWRFISRNIDEKANWASRIPYAIERVVGCAVAPIADVVADPLVEVCDQPEAEANARLIAAAPDMLAALKEAHRALMHYEWYANPKSGWALPENTTLRGTVDAAIARAEAR